MQGLPCTHLFHNKCLSAWINVSPIRPLCPNCKIPMDIQTPEQLVRYRRELHNQELLDARESQFNHRVSAGFFDRPTHAHHGPHGPGCACMRPIDDAGESAVMLMELFRGHLLLGQPFEPMPPLAAGIPPPIEIIAGAHGEPQPIIIYSDSDSDMPLLEDEMVPPAPIVYDISDVDDVAEVKAADVAEVKAADVADVDFDDDVDFDFDDDEVADIAEVAEVKAAYECFKAAEAAFKAAEAAFKAAEAAYVASNDEDEDNTAEVVYKAAESAYEAAEAAFDTAEAAYVAAEDVAAEDAAAEDAAAQDEAVYNEFVCLFRENYYEDDDDLPDLI
jgi:hypothetical protein